MNTQELDYIALFFRKSKELESMYIADFYNGPLDAIKSYIKDMNNLDYKYAHDGFIDDDTFIILDQMGDIYEYDDKNKEEPTA